MNPAATGLSVADRHAPWTLRVLFLATGAWSVALGPFSVVILRSHGLDTVTIGLLSALIALAATAIVPAWGHLADVLVGRVYAFQLAIAIAVACAIALLLPLPVAVLAPILAELRRPVPGDLPCARQRAGGRRLVDAGAAVRRAPGARQPVVRGRGDRRRRPLRPGGVCGRPRRRADLVGHPVACCWPVSPTAPAIPRSGRRLSPAWETPRAAGSARSVGRSRSSPACGPCSGSWPWPTPASSERRSSWRSGSSSWAGSPPTSPSPSGSPRSRRSRASSSPAGSPVAWGCAG